MPQFEIHTEEVVHGMYVVTAENEEEARSKFEAGDVPRPSLFETTDASIDSVKEIQ